MQLTHALICDGHTTEEKSLLLPTCGPSRAERGAHGWGSMHLLVCGWVYVRTCGDAVISPPCAQWGGHIATFTGRAPVLGSGSLSEYCPSYGGIEGRVSCRWHGLVPAWHPAPGQVYSCSLPGRGQLTSGGRTRVSVLGAC